MNDEKKKKDFISCIELAKILGVSRITIFKRIKKGLIPAERFGRGYLISMDYVHGLKSGRAINQISEQDKKFEIENAVKKVVDEYGDTLKLLGKE